MDKQTLSAKDISKIVDGFDPIDRMQVKLIASLPPGKRIIPMLRATEMIRAGLRSAFTKKFPELSRSEINMKILNYMTDMDRLNGHI